MTKSITVARQQASNFAEKKYTVGLDLGDRWSWYCVLDERGEVVFERKVSTTPKALREVFGAMPHSRVALETGTHSPWISRLMKELGHEVIVAQASKVRLIGESRKKDDRLDARTLARLARVDPELLGPIQHRSARAQADLIMIRASRPGAGADSVDQCSAGPDEVLWGTVAELQMALEPLLRAIESLSQQILNYNKRIEHMARDRYPEVARLQQVKGVGTLIALAYVLTLGRSAAFYEESGSGLLRGVTTGAAETACPFPPPAPARQQ
jgi:transposase